MSTRTTALRTAEVALRTVSGFSADRCTITAAGITYFALISIFPLALVALSVAGFVFESEADREQLLDNVMDWLPLEEEGGRDDLEQVVDSIVDARGTLGIFGILSGLYTGSALFTAVRVALNGIFRGEKPRPFVVGKLVDIGMVIVFGALLLLSTASSFLLAFIGRLAEELTGDELAGATQLGMAAASIALSLAISAGLFLLLYSRIPATAVRWKYAIAGAILAAILFEALKIGFSQYAANFGNYNATYGSLGFVLLLLAFIYFTSQVTLLGAEAARATSEVATGWPFPPEASRVASVQARLEKVRNLVRKLTGRPAPPPPAAPPPLPPIAVATTVEPSFAASPTAHVTRPETTPAAAERPRPGVAATISAVALLIATILGAAISRRRNT